MSKENIKVITFRNKKDGEWINVEENKKRDWLTKIIFDVCPKCGKYAEQDLLSHSSGSRGEGSHTTMQYACGHIVKFTKEGLHYD